MTETDTNKRPLGTRWCGIGSYMAGLGLIAAVAALLGAAAGVLSPMGAFGAFGIGMLLCALSTVILLIGLAISKGSGGAISGPRAWGAWLTAVLVLAISMSQRPAVDGAPSIHDVTTDIDDPPLFVEIIAVREAGGAQNPPEYAREFAEAQQAAFPDLTTLEVSKAPGIVFAAAEGVVEELGWDVVSSDPATGRLEATASTSYFRFKDDVVVRVRATPGGSEVDIRSKSRVGRGDMGANAARMREFLARLQAATG